MKLEEINWKDLFHNGYVEQPQSHTLYGSHHALD
jgi:hypothetical protein